MEVKLLSGALGAEVSGIDLTDSSDENFNKINELLLEHKVIFFRDQPLTSEQQILLAKKFGPLETHAYVKGLENYTNFSNQGNEVAWGTIGNGIDRIYKGFVVDFINLNIINFPVFNIADISINIGFIILLFTIFKNNR